MKISGLDFSIFPKNKDPYWEKILTVQEFWDNIEKTDKGYFIRAWWD